MSDLQAGWAAGFVEPLRVRPGSKVALPEDFDPGERFGVTKKKEGVKLLDRGVRLLAEYQDRLVAAQDIYAVLVILHRMGSLVRPARRSQVVHPDLRRGGHRPDADRAVPAM
jgi:hypothetical protein